MNKHTTSISCAYNYCLQLASSHYENFPVASFLLPRHLRKHVAAIYAFARTADDISDEGNDTKQERLDKLKQYKYYLKNSVPSDNLIFIALQDTIKKYDLPLLLFNKLIDAFIQDVNTNQYNDFEEILSYCDKSANPIGRLLLHLTNNDDFENLILSDHICTALQLINFIQDVHSDISDRDRCYLPKDELEKFNVNIKQIIKRQQNINYEQLISLQLQRASDLLQQGKPLGAKLHGLFGLELRLIITSAEYVIKQLSIRRDIFSRPVVKTYNYPMIFLKAMLPYRGLNGC